MHTFVCIHWRELFFFSLGYYNNEINVGPWRFQLSAWKSPWKSLNLTYQCLYEPCIGFFLSLQMKYENHLLLKLYTHHSLSCQVLTQASFLFSFGPVALSWHWPGVPPANLPECQALNTNSIKVCSNCWYARYVHNFFETVPQALHLNVQNVCRGS